MTVGGLMQVTDFNTQTAEDRLELLASSLEKKMAKV